MVRAGEPRGHERRGFTLIELLVVVAIIALLISILLPSLSKARAQARTSLCASRAGQLVKAFLVYSDDFEETPPFMGRGWENCNDLPDVEWPEGSGITVRQWAYLEDWLMPNMPDYWMDAQVDWPEDVAQVRNGSLFNYVRFEAMYRCPEFERVSAGEKSQDVFNFTRSILGRKVFHRGEPEGADGSPWRTATTSFMGAPGPIVKTGQVHAPARLHMIMGERWNRHCAADPGDFQIAGGGLLEGMINENWMAADCMFGPLGNEIGQYHGSEVPSQIAPPGIEELVPKVKRANAGYYDGHAELDLDPLPDRTIAGIGDLAMGVAFYDWIRQHIFNQRGLSPDDIIIDNPFGG